MASLASEGRSAFLGAFFVTFLVTLALVPWQHSPRYVRVSLDEVRRPPVIVPMELDREAEPPRLLRRLLDVLVPDTHAGVIAPPPHPDAAAWPRGMVIHPPPFPDRMAVDIPTALDRALSALLAPWLASPS
jgi:hypothetical protein